MLYTVHYKKVWVLFCFLHADIPKFYDTFLNNCLDKYSSCHCFTISIHFFKWGVVTLEFFVKLVWSSALCCCPMLPGSNLITSKPSFFVIVNIEIIEPDVPDYRSRFFDRTTIVPISSNVILFAHTRAIKWFPVCQWNNPKENTWLTNMNSRWTVNTKTKANFNMTCTMRHFNNIFQKLLQVTRLYLLSRITIKRKNFYFRWRQAKNVGITIKMSPKFVPQSQLTTSQLWFGWWQCTKYFFSLQI